MFNKNPSGKCPYCGSGNFDETKTTERKEGQDRMFCLDCSKWSVRTTKNGIQYPTDEPGDEGGAPIIRG